MSRQMEEYHRYLAKHKAQCGYTVDPACDYSSFAEFRKVCSEGTHLEPRLCGGKLTPCDYASSGSYLMPDNTVIALFQHSQSGMVRKVVYASLEGFKRYSCPMPLNIYLYG